MYYKLKNTEKILKVAFMCILVTLIVSKYADAKVSGVCSDCHTMHNSQNGTSMVLDTIGSQNLNPNCIACHNEPRQVLLRLNCIGCHVQSESGPSSIAQPDNIPQVGHHDYSHNLEAGNYAYIYDPSGDDTHGHNVHGINGIGPDSYQISSTSPPPGYNSIYDPASPGYQGNVADPYQVMCAGQNGCHGNRSQPSQLLAIKGSHHADDSMLKFGANFRESTQGVGSGSTSDFTTTGKSYRFLYNVHGAEDSDWEASVSPTDHNEYKGIPFASRTGQTWGDISSISQLCAECHGNFHASDQITNQTPPNGSPWLRHPTDVVLPDSGEYSAYTTYSNEAPVARPISFFVTGLSNASNQVTPGTDIVMCLSCHRAHASPYPDILRWDYNNMIAGDPSKSGGCFTCHTQKNITP
jgi:predicted CXXCH cytochrome family protein